MLWYWPFLRCDATHERVGLRDFFSVSPQAQPRPTLVAPAVLVPQNRQRAAMILHAVETEPIPRALWQQRMDFNLIVRALGVWHVTDTQCGFKLFRGEVAAELFPEVRTDGFGFDVELLLLAQRRGYRIVEVPINWVDQPGSRVSVIKEGPRMLAQVLAARLRLGFGRGPRRAP